MDPHFKKLMQRGCRALDLTLDERALADLYCYYEQLRKWSRKVNLVARMGQEELVEKHFLDSLSLAGHLPQRCHLVDIGSGAGFPGLVVKTLRQEMRLSLVEPRQKRVSFLGHISRSLGLADVEIYPVQYQQCHALHHRRQLSEDSDEIGVSHLVSRAVADIGGFVEMVADTFPEDAELVMMKGPRWQEELSLAKPILAARGFRLEKSHSFELPFSRAGRVLLFFRKYVAVGDKEIS